MKIEILGMGCKKCNELYENAKQAAKELGMEVECAKVEDIQSIMGYGVMNTPAIVLDGKVKASGKVSSIEEIKAYLK